MSKLIKLELQDFKSYRGAQTIGPFDSLTSIIGPNGAGTSLAFILGKSNLMDAICFVLGVQSSQLRSSNVKELVYRPDSTAPAQQNSASVSAYYQKKDGTIVNFCRKFDHRICM